MKVGSSKPANGTNVYHIVFFDHDRSAYIFFKGCNFACKGCILKVSPWDCHLPAGVRMRLEGRGLKTLSVDEFASLIGRLDVRMAVLGGGEPTVDPALTTLVRILSGQGVYTVLLSNGHNLDTHVVKALEDAGLNEVCVSIKAFTPSIHLYYTGMSNRRVLENFRLLASSRLRLRAESVLIPGLVDAGEIECIARFIASVDPSIPFRVDGYLSVPGTPWPSATPREVAAAVEAARQHLRNVSCLYCGMPLSGGVRLVYPEA